MNTTHYLHLVQAAIDEVNASFPQQPAGLYEPLRYTMKLGGKRMRPLLTLMGAGLFTDKVEPAIPAAMGVELFHNFTLLHDDIMDNAPLRRGMQTVHEKWDVNTAILSGDVMYTQAFRYITKSPAAALADVLDMFLRTAAEVCEGQQYDMDFERQSKVTIEEYLRMIELKTAVLAGASLSIGALCVGAPQSEARKLYDFGRLFGIAFQLQDDILDVYGDPKTFGKQVGGDILANKKTFLLLSALQRANGLQREELLNWLQAPASAGTEKVEAVTAIFNQLGIRDLARECMNEHYHKAIDALHHTEADALRKAELRAFTDALMVREV
ncbi:MAG: polyprenyl synthetase family protein [Bacteroidia bacterium]|nr:polyprenyl synthetase family protein [Bacteroidia bacterium]